MRKIGLLEAFSIGVGGMVGGGIFAVLGLTIDLAKGAAPIAFMIAGLIALITSYSYAKLSIRYPSEGGTIEFIVQAFGNNFFSMLINNLLLMSYVIMLSLYAYAFGSYSSALFYGHDVEWFAKLASAGVILIFVFINLFGAFLTGKAEDIMVFAKIFILLGFIAIGMITFDPTQLHPQYWSDFLSISTGGLIIFLAYEGFELIANTARDVENPQKTLPLAYYSSVIFVIVLYVLIAIVTIGNVTFQEAKKASDYVLAIAAEPYLGHLGFVIIAIAAMLSTASAINATIYGAGRVGYLVAKFGELPRVFEKQIKNGYEGMIILGLLAIIFAISFNIENISIAGSIGFLLIFSLVNLANYKLSHQTNANRFIALLGFVLTSAATLILIGYNIIHNPKNLLSSSLVILGVAFFSYVYYKMEHAKLSLYIDKNLEQDEKEK
ncbi:MAG: amino acid permease [Epsilonproteobacteria bacterium]|nr:amino acid permease [Campylobacterota bacterium]